MLALRIPTPLVREAPAIYRPRRPQEGLLYRLLRHVREKSATDADPHGARDPPAA